MKHEQALKENFTNLYVQVWKDNFNMSSITQIQAQNI